MMARGDGTGPMGAGPMTGRAVGYCAGNNMAGFENMAIGRGGRGAWGRGWYGRSGGPGWRGRWGAFPSETSDRLDVSTSPGEEVTLAQLKLQMAACERSLKSIQEQIARVEQQDAAD